MCSTPSLRNTYSQHEDLTLLREVNFDRVRVGSYYCLAGQFLRFFSMKTRNGLCRLRTFEGCRADANRFGSTVSRLIAPPGFSCSVDKQATCGGNTKCVS